MKTIKRILFKLLPQKLFLSAMHRSFYLMYDLGFLKKNKEYKYHYMIRSIVEPTFNVVDIGANLGYFSKNFARLTPNGSVLSIEPIPPFYDVLNKFLAKYSNVTVVNCALGNEKGTLTMVMPETDGVLRTGLPHVARNEEEKKLHKTQDVAVLVGSELLGSLEKIDYIKCDVEGYEWIVFSEIKNVIALKRPIIQIEISPENESNMLAYFEELNYRQYGIADFKLIRESGTQKEQGDFLFVPNEKEDAFIQKMRSKNKLA